MSEQTTITLAATKLKGYGRGGGVSVNISGATVGGYGATLADAKDDAIKALLELATIQQSAAAATVYRDGSGDSLITVYYPHGTGTGTITIRANADGTMRVTCTGQGDGYPVDRADNAATQDNVERIR